MQAEHEHALELLGCANEPTVEEERNWPSVLGGLVGRTLALQCVLKSSPVRATDPVFLLTSIV
jgi:hypothetical protein